MIPSPPRITGRLASAAIAAATMWIPLPASSAERSAPYEEILQGPARSVVAVRYQLRPKERPKGGEGPKSRRVTTGIVTGPQGQVMINASSFPDPDDGPDVLEPFDFRIIVGGGREIAAQVAGLSRDLNLAFLRATDPSQLEIPRIDFGDGPPLKIGDEVVVIGLLSETYDFRPVAYAAHLNGQPRTSKTMYSMDVSLPDLCGGGLVVRPDGRPAGVVGLDLLPESWDGNDAGNLLSLFGSANQGQRPGYQMIYPAKLFSSLIASPPPIPVEDKENRGWLGITMQPLSRDLADYWGITGPGGVLLGAVLPDSPAAQAGLLPGDVLLNVAGEPLPIREGRDLPLMQKRIRSAGAGRAVPITVWRDGQIREVSVMLSPSPTTILTAEEYENDDFGLTVRELTYDLIQAMNLASGTRGVVVTKTERAGWAEVAGIDRGDIVQKIDGVEIEDLESFREVLETVKSEKRRQALFLVLRAYKTRFVRLQTDWR